MKHLKKMMALLVCVLAVGCMTACGSNNTDNATENGAAPNGTTGDTGTADDVNNRNENNVNDATNGTDNNDGALENAAEDVREGVDDVTGGQNEEGTSNNTDNNVRNNRSTVTE